MQIPIYQVDAFASQAFAGNPAAICPLNDWLPDELLQQIAAENNLSETAFVVPGGSGFDLRWFTPTVEVPLCGHATLAAGFVLLNVLEQTNDEVVFETKAGGLTVRALGERFEMDLPAAPVGSAAAPPNLEAAIGGEIDELLRSEDNYFAVFGSEREVRSLSPDFRRLSELAANVIATAPGDDYDCVSRYFAPAAGIDEDPVTGSAHCSLAPYWAERLGKTVLNAFQASQRGGEVECEPVGSRVLLRGDCVLYMQGRISV